MITKRYILSKAKSQQKKLRICGK